MEVTSTPKFSKNPENVNGDFNFNLEVANIQIWKNWTNIYYYDLV